MSEAVVVEPDLFACMGTQRAMRRIKPDPVPEAALRKLLWAATRAPSGANRQPWRFIVVRDPRKKRELGKLYAASFYASAGDFLARLPGNMPAAARASAERTYRSAKHLADHLHEAPFIVIVCQLPLGHEDGEVAGGSIFPAVQNLLLAARALGLAAALTTITTGNLPAVRRLLAIPDHAQVAAQVAIGWPVGRFGESVRKPAGDVTYIDAWGARLGAAAMEG
jgi:nitroreductase